MGSRSSPARSFACVLGLVATFGGCALAFDEGPAPTPAGVGDADVLLTSRDARHVFGIYAWGVDPTGAGAPDLLTWAADLVADTGTRTIRVTLSPTDPYGVNPPGAYHLATTAAAAPYHALFSDPRFETYLLTAYSEAAARHVWADGLDGAEQAAERDEITGLAAQLVTRYPDKTFILLNWEADNAIDPFRESPQAWDGYLAWTRARADGVAAARTAGARVYSGLELNRVGTPARPCDDAHRCIASHVAPQVNVDFYAYSSWQSLAMEVPVHELGARLQTDLDQILASVRTTRPELGKDRIIIGELGTARDMPETGECRAAARVAAAITGAQAWGVSCAVAWQIVDNGDTGTFRGFGLWKRSNEPSLLKAVFDGLYATQVATVPLAACPRINAGGVVDGTTYQPVSSPDAVIAIFGEGFAADVSPTGGENIVHIVQGDHHWLLGDHEGAWWYESASQINVKLPAGVRTDVPANVFVTSRHLDSNSAVLFAP